ncbi:MAG: alcohol dehydrogenase, partial [Verrucomicrobiaceae bacterium]|nr:alcohol dehydrogenase [Verrucomicrobiaceae bacterium]
SLMRVALFLAAIVTSGALATDWPQWRGPRRNGTSDEAVITSFPSTGPKVLWKAEVGLGFSSFTIANGKVYTLGHAGEQDTVFCFDAKTGRESWKHSYDAELGDKYFEGGPTSTPTVSGNRVFSLSRWGDLFCFDAANGKVIWTKNLAKEMGATVPDWGFAGSPLVHDDLLILNVGDYGTALDKNTGSVRWKSGPESAGYCTPLPYKHDGRWFATAANTKGYYAVDLATGKPQWFFKWVTRYGINAADPIINGDEFLISTGYSKGCALIKPGTGEPAVVWQSRDLRTQMNPGVLVGGYVYGIDGDEGSRPELKCLEMATGKITWKVPSPKGGGLMVAQDKLIVLTGQGELSIAKASPSGFDPLATAQILKGKCWTAPVLANGVLYCRNAEGTVVALDVKESATPRTLP